MSVPAPTGPSPRLSRRGALVVLGGVATTSACTGGTSGQGAADEPPGGPVTAPAQTRPGRDPDVVVATEALTAQREMLTLLAAVLERHAALGSALAPLRAAHQAHVELLAGAVPEESAPPSPSPSPSPSPGSPAGAGTADPPRVPRAPAPALRLVSAAEQELATRTKRLAFVAESGAFARLLGSMAASAAQHAQVLRRGERP